MEPTEARRHLFGKIFSFLFNLLFYRVIFTFDLNVLYHNRGRADHIGIMIWHQVNYPIQFCTVNQFLAGSVELARIVPASICKYNVVFLRGIGFQRKAETIIHVVFGMYMQRQVPKARSIEEIDQCVENGAGYRYFFSVYVYIGEL